MIVLLVNVSVDISELFSVGDIDGDKLNWIGFIVLIFSFMMFVISLGCMIFLFMLYLFFSILVIIDMEGLILGLFWVYSSFIFSNWCVFLVLKLCFMVLLMMFLSLLDFESV